MIKLAIVLCERIIECNSKVCKYLLVSILETVL